MPQNNTVLMEGVRIIFRNFAGRETAYNQEGRKTFAVILDEPTAEAMAADEWNVKRMRPRVEEEEEVGQAFLPVFIRYDVGRPPKVVLITSRGRTFLDEGSIEMLDWVDIINTDLIVRPYVWNFNNKSGVKAMLQSLYVTIHEDPLEMKYAEQVDQTHDNR